MSRRSDPERITIAMEAGTRSRLTGELRLLPERARELLEAWAAEAATRGLDRQDSRYWDDGWTWMAERGRR